MTSDAVRRLADKYRLKTGDQVPQPPPRAETTPAVKRRSRRSPEWTRTFEALQPAAVYIAGYAAPVPRGFADNRGVWPIRIGITTRWVDSLTKEMDRHQPVHWMGVWFRVWTLSFESAGQLAFAVANSIADMLEPGSQGGEDPLSQMHREIVRWVRAEKLRNAFLDLGPDFDLEQINTQAVVRDLALADPQTAEENREQHFRIVRRKFELAIHHLAGDLCIQAWDGEAFDAYIDGLVRQQNARVIGQRPRR
ncbi:MAG: hypothetical protein F9K29_08035 [Hyphomicrobiaceae bacterium]|nr:MAG: hypothetical protein F9K29_08035 [Hyphomicrobiaceae bacterium]